MRVDAADAAPEQGMAINEPEDFRVHGNDGRGQIGKVG
jgi:hypothetical protein